MAFTATIDGLDELKSAWNNAVDRTRTELREVSLAAAAEGVRDAQAEHPYTDRTHHLTGDSHAEQTNDGEAEMVWPAEYAGFVDKGTSRSAAYPFTPIAEARAESVLAYGAEHVLETILAKV